MDPISITSYSHERDAPEITKLCENQEEHTYMNDLLSQPVDFFNLKYLRKEYIQKSENPEDEITLLTVKEGITPDMRHLDASGTLKKNATVLIRWMVFRCDGTLCESSDASGEVFQLGSTTSRQKMKIVPFFNILYYLKIGQICWLCYKNNSKTFIPGLYNHYPLDERLWVCVAFLGMYKPPQPLQRTCSTFDEFLELALERKQQADLLFEQGKFSKAYRKYLFVETTFPASVLIGIDSDKAARYGEFRQSIFKNMMISLQNLKLFETMVKHGEEYYEDFPDSCEVLFYLAVALKNINSITDAIMYLQKAFNLNKEFVEAKEEMKSLIILKKSSTNWQTKSTFCKNIFNDENYEKIVPKLNLAEKIQQKRERHIKEGKFFY